jgi:hypothetical protein
MAAIRTFCLLAAVSALLGALPAAAQVDANKLKPGDKLEMERGGEWTVVEFVEKISDHSVRVKHPDFPVPIGTSVKRLRRAKPGRMAEEAPKDNPFATPDEKIAQTAKKRTWTDPSGKFRVEATLVRIDGDKVVLKRDDGKEIAVPLERLSDADRTYVSALSSPASPGAPGQPKVAEAAPGVPVKTTDLPSATQCTIASDVDWKYAPAAGSSGVALAPVQLSLQPMSAHARALRMLFAPAEKRIFAVFEEPQFGGKEALIHVQACDLTRRKVESAGTFAAAMAPLAVSPDGKMVVARSEKSGFGGQSELQLFERDGNKVKPRMAWFPFRHHPSPFGNAPPRGNEAEDPDRPRLGREADVSWADFLDPAHLMTVSAGGEIGVWKLPEIEPVYHLPADSIVGGPFLVPAMSAGNVYVALPTRDGVALLRTSDGNQVGFLPADVSAASMYRLAWSDDGTRLAMAQPGRVRVWDLSQQEMIRDFPVTSGNILQDCGWAGNSHLFLNGRILIDVERRIPVSVLPLSGNENQFAGGVSWSLEHRGLMAPTITGIAPKPKNFKDPAKGKSAENLLVIRPGMEVTVELPPGNTPDGVDPRAAVIERLEQIGMKVVPASSTRLVGTLASGATQTVRYRTFGLNRTIMEAPVTEQVLTLSLTVDGETVWKHEARMGAPPSIDMKEGETLTDALARVRKLDGSDFGRVWIPAWVARVPDEVQASLAGKPKGA